MRKYWLVVCGMLLTLPFAATAIAQDAVDQAPAEDVGVGPAVVPAPVDYGPPVCDWGYYAYYPYDRIGFTAGTSSVPARGTTGAGAAADTAIAAATADASAMVDADTVTADVAPMRAGELMAAESLAAQATQVERALMAAEPAGLRLAEADIAAAVWVAAGTLVAAAIAVAAEAIWVAEASMVAAADTAAADTGKCSGFS